MAITLADEKPARSSQRFSLTVQTDEQLAAGQWRTLPCGLDVLLAPANTQEFKRVAAQVLRRVAGPKARDLTDLALDKRDSFIVEVMARASFKGFRDPVTKKPEVEINGEVKEDSLESRLWILNNLPLLRQEIDEASGLVNADWEDETETAGKN